MNAYYRQEIFYTVGLQSSLQTSLQRRTANIKQRKLQDSVFNIAANSIDVFFMYFTLKID